MSVEKKPKKSILQIVPFSLFGIICVGFMIYSIQSNKSTKEKETIHQAEVTKVVEMAQQQAEDARRMAEQQAAVIAKLEAELEACRGE